MSTAVATKPAAGQMSIKQHLQSPTMIAEIGKAMPAHCSPERMARIAITALTRTPKLADCTPASFFECLLSLSQWGLEPDGRRAHLIPYGNKCTLIIDYKGYVELAYRSGIVRNIHADIVREGDIFSYSMGRVHAHTPWFLRRDEGKPDKQGEVFAVYCQIELTGDTVKTEVLSREDVEAIRKRSRSGSNGPWVTDWAEMAKKTAFRRATKWIPLSAELRDAFDRDDDTLDGMIVNRQEPQRPQTVSDLSAMLLESHPQQDDPQAFQPDEEPVADDDASLLDGALDGFSRAKNEADALDWHDMYSAKPLSANQCVALDDMRDAALQRLSAARPQGKGKQGNLV